MRYLVALAVLLGELQCGSHCGRRSPLPASPRQSVTRSRNSRRVPTSCSSSRMTLGWADLGSYGATDIRTPNLDGLAREGLRLTDFYANGVTCSPTRAALVSGRYQQRYGIEAPLPNADRAGDAGLPATGYSLPQLLKDHGYATALIGKWHLGYRPRRAPIRTDSTIFSGSRAAITITTRITAATASRIFGKTTNRSREGLHDRSRDRACRSVHRGAQGRAVLRRRCLHGAALALSGAGQARPLRRTTLAM